MSKRSYFAVTPHHCPGFLSDCYDELGCRYVLPPYVLSRPTNIVTSKPEPSNEPVIPTSPVTMAPDMYLKIRLSIGDATTDEKLPVNSLERIADVKERIRQNHNLGLSRIRMICCGKILNDKTAIKDAKIPKSFIVQVIVSTDLEWATSRAMLPWKLFFDLWDIEERERAEFETLLIWIDNCNFYCGFE